MTNIVTRQTGPTSLDRPLTNTEIDTNFINLNNDKVDTLETYSDPVWLSNLNETKVLPSQTGFSSALLLTNGTNSYWENTQTVIGNTFVNIYSLGNPDVYYVSKNGNDSNTGATLENAFLTLKHACSIVAPLVDANPTKRITIFLKTGDYTELNPVTIPPRVAIVGDSLRSVSIRPANLSEDILYVNNGCYVSGATFRGHIAPTAAIAFNPNGSAGAIVTSPYIQNCSSITTTGVGIRIDGSLVQGIKGMVMDAYTQYNQGGTGVHILNSGYAQLVSIFTICTHIGILCESGGQCSVTNSNSSFGTFGLKASGVGPILDSGISSTVNLPGNTIVLTGLSVRPSANDVIKFIDTIPAYSGYYSIDYATPLIDGTCTVILQESVPQIEIGTSFSIHRRSLISASGHTFEYVGAGTDITTALPNLGGIPIQDNEVIMENGGKVYYTSTDHKGDFRIGDGLTINNATSTISGRAFITSLFANMAPYMLALS